MRLLDELFCDSDCIELEFLGMKYLFFVVWLTLKVSLNMVNCYWVVLTYDVFLRYFKIECCDYFKSSTQVKIWQLTAQLNLKQV